MLQQIKELIGAIGYISKIFGYPDIEKKADSLCYLVKEAEDSMRDMQSALHDSHRQCANLAGKVAELQAQLNKLGSISESMAKEIDNIVRISFDGFVSPEDIEKLQLSAKNYKSYSKNTLHEIHRAYGVEHVDTGVNHD